MLPPSSFLGKDEERSNEEDGAGADEGAEEWEWEWEWEWVVFVVVVVVAPNMVWCGDVDGEDCLDELLVTLDCGEGDDGTDSGDDVEDCDQVVPDDDDDEGPGPPTGCMGSGAAMPWPLPPLPLPAPALPPPDPPPRPRRRCNDDDDDDDDDAGVSSLRQLMSSEKSCRDDFSSCSDCFANSIFSGFATANARRRCC